MNNLVQKYLIRWVNVERLLRDHPESCDGCDKIRYQIGLVLDGTGGKWERWWRESTRNNFLLSSMIDGYQSNSSSAQSCSKLLNTLADE